MNQSSKDAAENLALIRQMMDMGRQKACYDSGYMIIWGGVLTLAFIAHYSAAIGLIDVSMIGIWIVASIIGSALTARMAMKERERQQMENPIAKGISTLWMGLGSTIGLYFFLSVWQGNFNPETIVILTAGIYGIACFATGTFVNEQIMRFAGLGWWAIFIYAIVGTPLGVNMLALFAAACFGLVFVPGLVLRRKMEGGE